MRPLFWRIHFTWKIPILDRVDVIKLDVITLNPQAYDGSMMTNKSVSNFFNKRIQQGGDRQKAFEIYCQYVDALTQAA